MKEFDIEVDGYDSIPGGITMLNGKTYYLSGRMDKRGRVIYQERVQ